MIEVNEQYCEKIARELNISARQVQATLILLDEGATVPFISRYRKEMTGSLDEVAVTAVRDRVAQLRELDKRRDAIISSLDERGLLTDELRDKLNAAETMTVLEDIYLPYRPKRRTRATIAREKGLEPLAVLLFEQGEIDPLKEAQAFVDIEKEVLSAEDALAGARDIIAEWVSEHQEARADIRNLYAASGIFRSKVVSGKEEEGAKYRDYFEWEEPVTAIPSHRILAMRRGENESMLSLRVIAPEEEALAILERLFIKGGGPASQQVRMAAHDGYKRLLAPSMETEIRLVLKQRADEEAIRIFAENARQLLLAPPLGGKNILAVDPGFRTGCKVCCLDRQGKLLHNDVIYPHMSEESTRQAAQKITDFCARFNIEVIAVGNGTAGRETEAFLRKLDLPGQIPVVMVNESGASIYSASEVAREEFPGHDVTVRSTVSIGRRLMDPLAELVKIDPKSIGVGQYQHDVDQGLLKEKLDDVVVSCVNSVGVEVNTASKQLLTYVSGFGPALAQNIISYRDEHGPFRARKELLNVPRLGGKAFEQAAGFLRIRNGDNPLDASAVHPESYPVVETMARDLRSTVKDLMLSDDLRKRIDVSRYVTVSVGMPTLTDIMSELARPGRDPRTQFEIFAFADGVTKIEDLKPGMKVPGVVTNITAFGAFVDIGVHRDGLVHISQMADRFVKNPSEVVSVHQKVMVTVVEVDVGRGRISLSMK
ncbi:RNA-binding transcriptional accessory protein [bacterium]|nr:RNA-binding transcriptional accessory protein [bacterium]